jgi:hypothetical protein
VVGGQEGSRAESASGLDQLRGRWSRPASLVQCRWREATGDGRDQTEGTRQRLRTGVPEEDTEGRDEEGGKKQVGLDGTGGGRGRV